MRNIHTQVDNYMASSPELLEQFILQLNNLKKQTDETSHEKYSHTRGCLFGEFHMYK